MEADFGKSTELEPCRLAHLKPIQNDQHLEWDGPGGPLVRK